MNEIGALGNTVVTTAGVGDLKVSVTEGQAGEDDSAVIASGAAAHV